MMSLGWKQLCPRVRIALQMCCVSPCCFGTFCERTLPRKAWIRGDPSLGTCHQTCGRIVRCWDFQYCIRALEEVSLLGFEMSQKSNVTPPFWMLSWFESQKVILCVSLQRQQKVKVENYLFLDGLRLSVGERLVGGSCPGSMIALCCMSVWSCRYICSS